MSFRTWKRSLRDIWRRIISGPNRSPRPSRSFRARPSLEVLEGRIVPANLLVNSLFDDMTPGDSLVTLREAIFAANNSTTTDLGQTGTGVDTITFDPSLTSN